MPKIETQFLANQANRFERGIFRLTEFQQKTLTAFETLLGLRMTQTHKQKNLTQYKNVSGFFSIFIVKTLVY